MSRVKANNTAARKYSKQVSLINPEADMPVSRGQFGLAGKAILEHFEIPHFVTFETIPSLIYNSRGRFLLDGDNETKEEKVVEDANADLGLSAIIAPPSEEQETLYASQRKVVHALIGMIDKEKMAGFFYQKGGIEAILKLVQESKDEGVLELCAKCLMLASNTEEHCIVLLEKQVLSYLNILMDRGSEEIRLNCAVLICHLACAPMPHTDKFVNGGAIGLIHSLYSVCDRFDILCYTVLAVNNSAHAIFGNEAEIVTRVCIQTAKKLDIGHNPYTAQFMSKILCNLSRLVNFAENLTEESVVPLMLHLIEMHDNEEIVENATETILNLSNRTKNRREIAGSGLANQLDLIIRSGGTTSVSNILMTIGNLLQGDYFFHDRVARDDVISNILNNLFDIQKPDQFIGVGYCVSQLAENDLCAKIMVRFGIIKLTIRYLDQCPPAARDYLWHVLVTLSKYDQFFDTFAFEKDDLFAILHEEVSEREGKDIEPAAKVAYNLAMHPSMNAILTDAQIEMFIRTIKLVVFKYPAFKAEMLNVLCNLAAHVPFSRPYILGDDLIEVFESGDKKSTTVAMYLQYVALLNLISCEESLCLQLLDIGAQNVLVDVQNTFMQIKKNASDPKKEKEERKGKGATREQQTTNNRGDDSSQQKKNETVPMMIQEEDFELGKGLIAATLHNLSFKRAVLAPGVLTVMTSLMKSTKSLRVYHTVRAMAHMACNSKTRVQLSRERVLPKFLTGIMRFGCDKADRVQHYCAIIICNIFSTKIDRDFMAELIDSGTIMDLVVVTLLRVNSVTTKESLGKALFNLASPAETRVQICTKMDVFSAIIELARPTQRLESADLQELCMRAIYNISCHIPREKKSPYADKLRALKIPYLLVTKVSSFPPFYTTKDGETKKTAVSGIKSLCGMALANMSFDDVLAAEINRVQVMLELNGRMVKQDEEEDASSIGDSDEREKKSVNVTDTAYSIFGLNSDEATYCASVLLYNLSKQASCVLLADKKAVSLLSAILAKGPFLCVQLATAALCNFSKHLQFHFQLCEQALQPIIKVISNATLEIDTRCNALQTLYNIVTNYGRARVLAIQSDAVAAMQQLSKAQTKYNVLPIIGRILREFCLEAGDDQVHRKILMDGGMLLLLKLSKEEIPTLKNDVSNCIYYLTTGGDTMKVLKWDSVDILFWLTIYDCMSLQDEVQHNVGKALRNFTSSAMEAKILVKEDRFMAVLRALAKSHNKDVLWQAAGICYNLFAVEDARKSFLARGAIMLIFDLAASGYLSVKQVCSACIHMVPDAVPDMDNPLVLDLVLCLLEVDGEKYSNLGEKSLDPLPYDQLPVIEGAEVDVTETPFHPSWVTITCDVDTVFSPASLPIPPVKALASSVSDMCATMDPDKVYTKYAGEEFNNFVHFWEGSQFAELGRDPESSHYIPTSQGSTRPVSRDADAANHLHHRLATPPVDAIPPSGQGTRKRSQTGNQRSRTPSDSDFPDTRDSPVGRSRQNTANVQLAEPNQAGGANSSLTRENSFSAPYQTRRGSLSLFPPAGSGRRGSGDVADDIASSSGDSKAEIVDANALSLPALSAIGKKTVPDDTVNVIRKAGGPSKASLKKKPKKEARFMGGTTKGSTGGGAGRVDADHRFKDSHTSLFTEPGSSEF